jgi:gentisate 1,2-dioxygenase
MSTPTESTQRPTVLVGEATEDWTGDAVFYEYTAAADPLASGTTGPVPVHSFPAAVHAGGPTRLVPLDLSARLDVPYPATSPGLLASFAVIRPGERLATEPEATSELYYCLRGDGHTDLVTTGVAPLRMGWGQGDFFTLPAGYDCGHVAGDAGVLLYRVTDAPLLRYLGAVAVQPRFAPTRFDGGEALARLAEVEADPAAEGRSRVSVLLGNTATPRTLTVTHTLWAMLGVLPAGRVQRPHRHQSAAVDLITGCEPGCYSLVGSRLDATGTIVDAVRVDWEPGGAFVTPPGLWHSHHN